MTTLSELVRLQEEATPGPWHNARHNGEPISIATDPRSPREYVANGELIDAARNFDFKGISDVVEAARNLRDVKGRFHSEQAYKRLVDALASLDTKARGDGNG